MEYPNNSNAHRNRENADNDLKPIKRITNGRKQSHGGRLFAAITDFILAEISDAVLPDVYDIGYKVVMDIADSIFYPDDSGRSKKSSEISSSRIGNFDYSSKSTSSSSRREKNRKREKSGYKYEDVLYDTKPKAIEVYEYLRNRLDDYNMVTVADLYDASYIASEYVDNSYGWLELPEKPDIVRVRGQYLLRMPKIQPLYD